MKKVMFTLSLALFLLLGLSVKAEAPTCSEGTHYVGEYVESESCENVCVKKIWGFCVKYERKCETVGNWVGECVADEVVVPEPEATSTPAVEPSDKPQLIASDLSWMWNGICKPEQINYVKDGGCLRQFNFYEGNPVKGLQVYKYEALNGCYLNPYQLSQLVRECE